MSVSSPDGILKSVKQEDIDDVVDHDFRGGDDDPKSLKKPKVVTIDAPPEESLKKPKPRREKTQEEKNKMAFIEHLSKRKEHEKYCDVLLSGTSATVVIQTKKKIYYGWVGDSLIALQGSHRNADQSFFKSEDLFMNYPGHKPVNPKEKVRIYNKRGEIRESPVDGKSRVYMRARMYPSLPNSRSLGDLLGHQIGVISKP